MKPSRPRTRGLGVWSAFLFNICLVLLPLASAGALFIASRDDLYAYKMNDGVARTVRARIERETGDLIQVDFDRRRQWEELIEEELRRGDIHAARGFLLSARAMLSSGDVNQIDRAVRGAANDAEIELAALELLSPSTRARYEGIVPLLSRRAASGAATTRPREHFDTLGDNPSDFETLARALIADTDTSTLHFVLTGLKFGLGGELSERQIAGATVLETASSRDDFTEGPAEAIDELIASVAPADAFRREALRRAEAGENEDAAAYPIASAAFRAVADPVRVAAAAALLDELGAMREATSNETAATLVTHARSLHDMPRLRLVAEAAGDRAAAAAKWTPRDGSLARAAVGTLTFSRTLLVMLALAALAAAGLIFAVGAAAVQAVRHVWEQLGHRRQSSELVQSFDTTPWRAL